MFIQCGSPLLNISVSPRNTLRGSLNITAPFVIEESLTLISSLSISGSLKLPIMEGFTGELLIYALFSEVYSGSSEIPISLSAMDDETVSLQMLNSLSASGRVGILSELSERYSGTVTSLNTIGEYAIRASTEIRVPLGYSDLSGRCEIRLPQTTAHIIKDELKVYADGTDITKLLKSAKIKLFGNNEPMKLTAVLEPLKRTPENITIYINNELYEFKTSTAEHSPERCTLTGSIPSRYSSVSADFKRASALCAENTDIIFAADDFITQGGKGRR